MLRLTDTKLKAQAWLESWDTRSPMVMRLILVLSLVLLSMLVL